VKSHAIAGLMQRSLLGIPLDIFSVFNLKIDNTEKSSV
jgi:hypothetical protein